MGLLPVRRRLVLLGLLGVLLTVSVAAAALVCLGHVTAINRELAEVGRAQRFHQDADMMHDALRADVARAQQAASGDSTVSATAVRRDVDRHVAQFHRDMAGIDGLVLPGGLRQALDKLRPEQTAYVDSAERLVESALRGDGGDSTAAALPEYQQAFHRLVPAQAQVTRQLSETAARTERAADHERQEATQMVALSSFGAMAGWLVLVAWHNRSIGSLHGALMREAEQRSAVDLLQRSLLPKRLPPIPGVDLAARSLPGAQGQRVGGDWYDVISLPSGEVGLVVGDVVGHDLPAASAMGQLRNALRAYALDDSSPAGVLTRVNRAADLLDVVDLATCLYAVLDPATLTVRWASAGHLPPLVSTADGGTRLEGPEPGAPLGALPDARFRDHALQLAPGDALLLYTDGLVERRGAALDAGLEALVAAFSHREAEVEAMCDGVLQRVLGGAPASDDVTVLLLQAQSASPASAA